MARRRGLGGLAPRRLGGVPTPCRSRHGAPRLAHVHGAVQEGAFLELHPAGAHLAFDLARCLELETRLGHERSADLPGHDSILRMNLAGDRALPSDHDRFPGLDGPFDRALDAYG